MSSTRYLSVHSDEETARGGGNNCLKGEEETILGTHIELGIVFVHTSQSEKLLKSWDIRWSTLKGFASVVERN